MLNVLTVNQAADQLGVSTDTLYSMIKESKIKHIKIMRRLFIHMDELSNREY